MRLGVLFATSLVFAAPGAAQRPGPDCVKFARAERLESGTSFSFDLPRGLRFVLAASDDGAWEINVVDPRTTDVDYMWVASPPYQTAPQRSIGAFYGQSAAENASFTRELHFVLTAEDHKKMFDLLAARARSAMVLEALDALTTGTLTLDVTGFQTRTFTLHDGSRHEGFAWITFTGEACVPR